MIRKAEVARKSKEWNIRFDVVEKDFCIGWLLKGISEHSQIGNGLIFKGGTALRKCYFQNYRFSEDLDFTAQPELKKDTIEQALADAAVKTSLESGCKFMLVSFEKLRDLPNEEAFEARISFRGLRNHRI